MSHHLDSPFAKADGRVGLTDVFAFRNAAADHTVFVINTCFDAGKSSPTVLHPEATYELHIDDDGDLHENLSWRIIAAPFIGLTPQTVRVQHRSAIDAPWRDVAKGLSGDTMAMVGGGQAWVGLAADHFAANGHAFFPCLHGLHDHNQFDLTPFETVENLFEGRNVVSMVLEIPNTAFVRPDVNIWATINLTTDGVTTQMSRWGKPASQFLFNANDHDMAFVNQGHPSTDLADHLDRAIARTAHVVSVAGTHHNPQAYGEQVARVFFPLVLPYRIGTSASYTFAGINGRALVDDVMDVVTAVYFNRPVDDQVVPMAHGDQFPYVNEPFENDLPALLG
jgi:hypothetical protein